MHRDEYVAANRLAWNEVAPRHAASNFADLTAAFARPGYSCLDAVATGILSDIGVAGKAVAHLCCNNGRELLSVKNMRADRCVGFDVSDAFIAQARALAEAGNLDCTFVRTNVYDIGLEFDAAFGLVLFPVGGITWMPDLAGCLRVAARLLRPGGALFIYDMHPVLEMFDADATDSPLSPRYSYFQTAPFVETDGLDYYSREGYDAQPAYSFLHTLSDVFTACLRQGLTIDAFTEYDHDIGTLFGHFLSGTVTPPMSYTLVCRKPA